MPLVRERSSISRELPLLWRLWLESRIRGSFTVCSSIYITLIAGKNKGVDAWWTGLVDIYVHRIKEAK